MIVWLLVYGAPVLFWLAIDGLGFVARAWFMWRRKVGAWGW